MAKRQDRPGRKREFDQAHEYKITDLDQIKVLADPLRIRILEACCRKAATTSQIAEELGEKPTKLYHHVEALSRVGLIRLVRTRQNRGTLEKYYQAVARRFEADPSLFISTEAETDSAPADLMKVFETVLNRTSRELSALAKRGEGDQLQEDGLFSFVAIHAERERIREFRDRIRKLVESFAEECESPGDADRKRKFRLTLALYPLQDD